MLLVFIYIYIRITNVQNLIFLLLSILGIAYLIQFLYNLFLDGSKSIEGKFKQ